jgi:hypothetical protein
MDSNSEPKPIIKLYKLDDPVKNEIFKALNFYSKFDVARDLMLLDRANTCLTNVYDTVNPDDVSNASAGSTTDVAPLSDAMYKHNVDNTLKAFEGFLNTLLTKDPTNTTLKMITLNFQKMVKDSLNVK